MFTGLVRERGRLVRAPEPSAQGGVRLTLGHSRSLGDELDIGASLSVSGVCLTIVELDLEDDGATSIVELSPETLSRTTLGDLRQGSRVNLEPAMRLGDVLGGHWVQGHVDATTEVVARRDLEEHREIAFALTDEYRGFVVEKGSVTLDGISLTVSALAEDHFEVALIPHTLKVTTFGALEVGDRVNLEVDVLSKYVQRALQTSGVIPR